MIVGVPREVKVGESRVGLTPYGAATLIGDGHRVLLEAGAGAKSGFTDENYRGAGVEIVHEREAVFNKADLIVKVKEPQDDEIGLLQRGKILFTYLHLASSEQLTEGLLGSGVIGIAYETIRDGARLPLLIPMSQIAGKLATQIGARYLEGSEGGQGILLGGVPGVARARVLILGGGTAGVNAASVALGMGAHVSILDIDSGRLQYISDLFGGQVETLVSTEETLGELVPTTDLLIGCVLIPGAPAPHVISRGHLCEMKSGAVIVDVAIDQGGCIESSRPTTHAKPVYHEEGVIHYCVPNIPALVSKTATRALTNTTLPFIRQVAANGWREAARRNTSIASGINLVYGEVVEPTVAQAFGLQSVCLEHIIKDAS